jgi:hypothetical protein
VVRPAPTRKAPRLQLGESVERHYSKIIPNNQMNRNEKRFATSEE